MLSKAALTLQFIFIRTIQLKFYKILNQLWISYEADIKLFKSKIADARKKCMSIFSLYEERKIFLDDELDK